MIDVDLWESLSNEVRNHNVAPGGASAQSKDGNDRLEEKVDLILKAVAENGDEAIRELDRVHQRD